MNNLVEILGEYPGDIAWQKHVDRLPAVDKSVAKTLGVTPDMARVLIYNIGGPVNSVDYVKEWMLRPLLGGSKSVAELIKTPEGNRVVRTMLMRMVPISDAFGEESGRCKPCGASTVNNVVEILYRGYPGDIAWQKYVDNFPAVDKSVAKTLGVTPDIARTMIYHIGHIGSVDYVREWMLWPLDALGGKSVAELIRTPEGNIVVRSMLMRMP